MRPGRTPRRLRNLCPGSDPHGFIVWPADPGPRRNRDLRTHLRRDGRIAPIGRARSSPGRLEFERRHEERGGLADVPAIHCPQGCRSLFRPLELTVSKDEVNHRIVRALEKARIPIVLLDRCILPYPHRCAHDLVGIDNRRAGYLAAEHLLKLGARRIVFAAQTGLGSHG